MSPEMLLLARNMRKDTEKYDRRKKMGTNRLSDIWSLGCLFFELLTGDVLFNSEEVYYRVIGDVEELIPKEKYEMLDNNVYLIDFLNFMLIKDFRLRPSISSVIKRFEHVHALLVVTGPSQFRVSSNKPYMTEATLVKNLDESVGLLQLQHENRLNLKSGADNSKNQVVNARALMTINEDISYCSKYLLKDQKTLMKSSITHIVSMAPRRELSHLCQIYDVLYIDELYEHDSSNLRPNIIYSKVLVSILDFIKKASIRKGKVLFVEEDELLDTTSPKSLVGEYIILCLSRMHQVSAYETYTKIRTVNATFDISHINLRQISSW